MKSRAQPAEERSTLIWQLVAGALMWGALIITIAATAAGSAAEREEPELMQTDFAWGRDIHPTTHDRLQIVPLDVVIYRGSIEPRLADLRVFNRAGDPVPHAVQVRGDKKPDEPTLVSLPLFRLPKGKNESEVLLARGGYRVDMNLGTGNATVRVEPSPAGSQATTGHGKDAEPKPEPIVGYLIDTTELDNAIVAFELELEPSSRNFVVPVRVEGSNDLVHFEVLTQAAAVAQLNDSERSIERHRVPFTRNQFDYLRITWPTTSAPLLVRSVKGELPSVHPAVQRRSAEISGNPIDGEAGAFLFDLRGHMPVDRVQVDLHQSNSVVEAKLYSGESEDGPWVREFRGLLFQVDGPSPARNDEIDWRTRRLRYAKLVVDAKAGGAGGRIPTLEVSWRPEQLLFIARGEPPYILAYGRAGAEASSFSASELLGAAQRPSNDSEPLEPTAQLDRQHAIAGASALEPQPEPLPMRTIALWVVLVACVGLIAAMSVQITREMS